MSDLSPPQRQSAVRLLRSRNVGRLFAAYLISFTGTAMAPIALAFGVLELTGSTSDASVVIASPTLAAIAVMLLGGVIADRTSRQKIIYRAELVAMLTQLAVAVLFITGRGSVPVLAACMLVNGLAMAFHAPASTGLIIQLVAPEDLRPTNALLGMARNGAITGGAALGGVLVATLGAGPTLLIDAASFGISAALVFSLKPRLQEAPEAASVIEDLKLGWRQFTSHTWLWVIVAQFSLVVASGEAVFGLVGPATTRDHMGGPTDWGLIAAGFGLGTLAGGVAAMRIDPPHPMRFATVCVLFFAGVPLALSVPAPLALVAAAGFVSGFAGQLFAVLWYTTLQTKIPATMLSRVSAYDHVGSIALAPLGIVVGGILYEAVGFRTTLLMAAATTIAATLVALCVKDVRNMTAGSPTMLRQHEASG